MIIGVGTDIVDIERITKIYTKQSEALIKRLLSSAELKELDTQHYPEQFLAKRWALKEAVAKALGTGITKGICFKDMTISHKASGQPILILDGTTLLKAEALGISHWTISVSDEKQYVVAFVIAE